MDSEALVESLIRDREPFSIRKPSVWYTPFASASGPTHSYIAVVRASFFWDGFWRSGKPANDKNNPIFPRNSSSSAIFHSERFFEICSLAFSNIYRLVSVAISIARASRNFISVSDRLSLFETNAITISQKSLLISWLANRWKRFVVSPMYTFPIHSTSPKRKYTEAFRISGRDFISLRDERGIMIAFPIHHVSSRVRTP